MKTPTQADIARMVGVSRATVSYVLNGRTGGAIGVADETRQRIFAAAEHLGYEPDAAAQSLRLRASMNIGVTMPDMTNPHLWQIVHGADECARSRGYSLLLLSTAGQKEAEIDSMRQVLRRKIDGLVLLQSREEHLNDEIERLARRHSPVAVLGDFLHKVKNLDTVTPGFLAGSRLMLDHLLGLGHRRIGFIFGVEREPLGMERLLIYEEKLRALHACLDSRLVIHTGPKISDGYEAARVLLDITPRPTAILVINDLLAVGAIRAIHEHGLRIPRDISVAGFDDIELAAYLNPALTTLHVNAEEVGREAVRLIFERMAEPERPAEHLCLPAQLVVRDSTGPVPVRVP